MSTVPASVERTKPYVLVVGQVGDAAFQEYLDGLGSGVGYAGAPEDVRQQDYDFIIDLGAAVDHGIEGDATVLRFEDGEWIGPLAQVGKQSLRGVTEGRTYRYKVARTRGQRASAFTLMDNPDDRLDFCALIADTILPNIHRAGDYTTIQVSGRTDYTVLPMLAEEGGAAIAAIINFPEFNSYWSLPPETTDQLRWVKFFLEVMKTIQPEAFPPDQVGLTSDWRTAAEAAASQAVSVHMDETETMMLERDRQLRELEGERDAATEAAEAGERLLLTAYSEALTDRVAEVLGKFGFDVEDRDEHATATQSSKKEDLRLTHPNLGDANWVCLTEVKGFTRGAKANVIQQIQKVAGIYEGQNGRPPSALWYVVNHHRNDPAQTRPAALASNPEEVAVFAADNGLVIDTRWLFQLEKRVDTRAMTPTEAAKALMGQTGMFTLPVENDVPAPETETVP